MEMEDFVEAEVGIAVALTAAVASPKVRHTLRKGAVYSLAGLLKAKDMVTNFAHHAVNGAREAASTVSNKSASKSHAKAAKSHD